jgi:two-component system nitrate/nitrite sensor histidine kinase NarX
MTEARAGGAAAKQAVIALNAEIERFDEVLAGLQRGDPARPLSLPRGEAVRERLATVASTWWQTLRPPAAAFSEADPSRRAELQAGFDRELEGAVAGINELVLAMERSYTESSALLRQVQGGLILLALVATAFLLRVLLKWVIRPI